VNIDTKFSSQLIKQFLTQNYLIFPWFFSHALTLDKLILFFLWILFTRLARNSPFWAILVPETRFTAACYVGAINVNRGMHGWCPPMPCMHKNNRVTQLTKFEKKWANIWPNQNSQIGADKLLSFNLGQLINILAMKIFKKELWWKGSLLKSIKNRQ